MTSNTDNLFTVEAARTADADAGKAMLTVVKRKVSTIQRNDRELRVAAAYAMHVHFRLAREAEESVSIAALGRDLGGNGTAVPTANIYLWRRLGAALVDLGIEPNTDEWSALQDVANRAPVSWALDGLDFSTIKVDANGKPTIKTDSYVGVTREAFDKALAYLYPDGLRDPENNKMHKARTSAEVNKAMVGEYGSEAEQAEVEAEANKARNQRAGEAARFLADNLKNLDADGWEKVGPHMQAILQAAKKHFDEAKKAEQAKKDADTAAA
jgi:hypothetical protein